MLIYIIVYVYMNIYDALNAMQYCLYINESGFRVWPLNEKTTMEVVEIETCPYIYIRIVSRVIIILQIEEMIMRF